MSLLARVEREIWRREALGFTRERDALRARLETAERVVDAAAWVVAVHDDALADDSAIDGLRSALAAHEAAKAGEVAG